MAQPPRLDSHILDWTMMVAVQVASLMCVYGPKVSLALALGAAATRSGEALAVELTMDGARWAVTNKVRSRAGQARKGPP